ncbi:hypothetical protein DL240_15030 [Lujinxingia litoralis]|uniref:HTTM domain-containing protein n=1 Tax=Lujinxingia litoralis TaxID=2211119 RepID=A0A328C3B7_9DELT|nr:hypothetical protein [Lujinxingia litoralis]RAL20982.1 hypothetical protein DL240_15030 [Lujinxingia litoralis]
MFQSPLTLVLGWHPPGRHFRLMTALYAFAGACHLWLADAWVPEWFWGNILFLLGICALPFMPSTPAWTLCALGKALPLLLGRDHLNQSLLLMLIALAAALTCLTGGLRASRQTTHELEPGDRDPNPPDSPALVEAFWLYLRGLTVAVYALSAFHKLNRDFLSPPISCGSYGVDKLLNYYQLSPAALPGVETLRTLAPFLVLGAEFGVALLYLGGRRKGALLLALAFHIPLTLTMAPAFAFVMLIGHSAFLTRQDLHAFRKSARRHRRVLLMATTALCAISLVAHGQLPALSLIPREALLWGLLIWVGLTPLPPRPCWRRRPKTPALTSRAPRLLATLALMLFVAHALTPYLGLRFQHTAAMVSNLRIDDGCWNHLLIPESWRMREDYIRINRTYFRHPGFLTEYEDKVLDQLWNTTQVRQMRRNWCREELHPFYLEGTFRSEPFVIEDLCAEELSWPFEAAGVFGPEIFKDHLRFQRNLPRTCPATCIH